MNETVKQNMSQVEGLSRLLQLEWDARQAKTKEELYFLMVNETHRLIPYDQAILWLPKMVVAVSGGAHVDRHSPFVDVMNSIAHHLFDTKTAKKVIPIVKEDIPHQHHQGWTECSHNFNIWCPLVCSDNSRVGAIILERKFPFTESDLRILERLMNAYAHHLSFLEIKTAFSVKKLWQRFIHSKAALIAIGVMFLVSFIPVKESILAPAEVVAKHPFSVNSPINGTIKQLHVEPNQEVKQGDLLLEFDDIELKAKASIAKKGWEVAKADLHVMVQKSFVDPESKSNVSIYEAKVKEKEAEFAYAEEQMKRIYVYAEKSGVVVFDDPNALIGRPLIIGEKILKISDPSKVILEAYIPASDATIVAEKAEVKFFLNISPLKSKHALLETVSYSAFVTPEDTVAYRAVAVFDEGNEIPRLGLKGTAKIYGNYVTLFYYVTRKPLAMFRQKIGF